MTTTSLDREQTDLDRPHTNTVKRNVLVGLFVVVGLAILAGGILAVGNIHSTFTGKINVTTSFPDVNGLQPGNNVWFSGLKVGTVSDLQFVGESQVRVSLKIDRATQRYVHKDAMAKLSSDGLIGNKIVVITSGTPGAPSIEDGDVLQTAAEPSTDDMLVLLQESNQDLRSVASDLKSITQQIASGQGTIGRLVYDDTMAQSLSSTTASLAEASQKADKTAAALSTYTSSLNQPGNLLHDVAHDKDMYPALKRSTEGLAAASEDAAAAAKGLRSATTETDSPAGVLLNDEEAAADLKATLENLQTSSAKLDEDLEAAQHAWPLRGGFKKKAKAEKKAAKEAAKAEEDEDSDEAAAK